MMVMVSKILRPSNPNPTKKSTYECGQSPRGVAHDFMFKGIERYFIWALIFFVFDSVLWIMVTYAMITKTFSHFLGFVGYLTIVTMGLACFLKALGQRRS
ncbi:MAG: NADH-quinone oxidoreductase subunit A [Candidatus Bathyarchaeia archaeon]